MYNKNRKRKCLMIFAIIMVIMSIIGDFNTITVVHASDVPRIVLESYNLAEGSFKKGENSVVRLRLKNTHSSLTASNILITYKNETNSVCSTFGNSNQIYIDSISPGETVEKDINLTVLGSADEKNTSMFFSVVYVEAKTKETVTEEFSFSIPVESMSFSNSVSVASSTTVGARTYISADLNNNSAYNDVYDLKMIVEGNVKSCDGEENVESEKNKVIFDIGNITKEKSNYAEKSISFIEEGKQKIKISFNYKDKSGEERTDTVGEYTVNVINKKNEGKNVVSVANNKISLIWMICIVVGIAATLAMVVLAIKTKKK